MWAGYLFFGVMALMVAGTAIGMVVSRSAIYSALFLVLNFATVALLYLMLGAPFIALVQVTVYAGSIMILFLFVIMLLGAERLEAREPLRGQRLLALVLGVILLAETALFFLLRARLTGEVGPAAAEAGSPALVGITLFTEYALPFQVTGFLLLVATVGAVLLTRGDKETAPTKPFSLRPEEK